MHQQSKSKFLEYKSLVQDDASFSRRYFVPPHPELGTTGCLRYHTDNVSAVRWTSDTECLTCSIDSALCKWNLEEFDVGAADRDPDAPTAQREHASAQTIELLQPQLVQTQAHSEGVYCVDVLNGVVATGASGSKHDDTLKLWDLKTLEETSCALKTESAVYSMRFRDPHFLVVGTKLGTCMFFDPAAERCIGNLNVLHKSVLQSVDLSESYGVLTGGSDGRIHLLDPRTHIGQGAGHEGAGSGSGESAYAGGGLSPSGGGTGSGGPNLSFVMVEKTAIYAVRWVSQSSHYFLSSGDNYCISRWDVRKMSSALGARRRGEQSVVTNYFGHSSEVRCLELLGSDFFVSGTGDGSLRIWPVDEVGVLEETMISHDMLLEKAEVDRADIEANVVAHAHTDQGRKRVQKNVELLHQLYDEMFELQEIYGERTALQCLQATYQLDAHSSLVCGVSARRCPRKKERWRILTSSADQTVKLFRLAQPLDKNRHMRWVNSNHRTTVINPADQPYYGGAPLLSHKRHDSLTRGFVGA
ncbi:unnamed protein product [Amoebophrya sp. A25]|nr:unnamed protein product [Amoebophrya sp. A25]|eukprot:GSA25T00011393001.1